MNERIKELARQAGLLSARVEGTKTRVLLATVPETNGEIADPDTQLGKFAELIVRECAAIVEAQKESLCDDESAWHDRDYGYEQAVNDSVDVIKQHFGVEE